MGITVPQLQAVWQTKNQMVLHAILAGIFPDDELCHGLQPNGQRPQRAPTRSLFGKDKRNFYSYSRCEFYSGTTRYIYDVSTGRWYGLQVKEELRETIIPNDPVGILDVSVLQNQVLAPMLGIENPRTDKRIALWVGFEVQSSITSSRQWRDGCGLSSLSNGYWSTLRCG